MRTAPGISRGGAEEKNRSKRGSASDSTPPAPSQDRVTILAEYREARRKLDEGLDLIREGLDLRERLWMQIDLEEAQRQAAEFRRAVANFKRARFERGWRP